MYPSTPPDATMLADPLLFPHEAGVVEAVAVRAVGSLTVTFVLLVQPLASVMI